MWKKEHREREAKLARKTKRYPSDMTDVEWAAVQPLLPRVAVRGRRRECDLREVANALRYLVRAGCGWRRDRFPPLRAVGPRLTRRNRVSGLARCARPALLAPRSTDQSAAWSCAWQSPRSATRASQFSHASRSARASVKTCSMACEPSTSSPLRRAKRTLLVCALTTSLTLQACSNDVPPVGDDTGPSGAYPPSCGVATLTGRVRVPLRAHSASARSGSTVPSASGVMRPAAMALRTAASDTPRCRA
ncbi:transposase [Ralstonia sp. SM1864_UCD524_TZ4]|uniref:transposase n=1 Tax=Ralstonia solanacearum species complex TaxID=3116862 RepID=UPI0022B0BE3E|nr:transposase [Ralstonia pseudosolanacearum]